MGTPLLTATPGAPPTYNPSMAETFSWIPVEGAGRPLFAQATYLANPEDIKISLSADNINVDLGQIEINTDQIETKLDTINDNINNVEPLFDIANTRLQTIASQTAFGTTPGQPLYVNPGALLDTVDSVSIDKSIGQTATTALTSKVFVLSGTKVYNIFGITTAGTNQYLQIYDSTTSAVPTSTPIGVFLIPANSNFSFDLNRGLNFTSGALIVNSITPVVYTQGNDDLFITVVHN
jgi:hypothetical protein